MKNIDIKEIKKFVEENPYGFVKITYNSHITYLHIYSIKESEYKGADGKIFYEVDGFYFEYRDKFLPHVKYEEGKFFFWEYFKFGIKEISFMTFSEADAIYQNKFDRFQTQPHYYASGNTLHSNAQLNINKFKKAITDKQNTIASIKDSIRNNYQAEKITILNHERYNLKMLENRLKELKNNRRIVQQKYPKHDVLPIKDYLNLRDRMSLLRNYNKYY